MIVRKVLRRYTRNSGSTQVPLTREAPSHVLIVAKQHPIERGYYANPQEPITF
jgi:hypothetical protein